MKKEELHLRRPRRNRKSDAIRALVQENTITPNDLIAPYFIVPGMGVKTPILSLPGQFHLSCDHLIEEVKSIQALGVKAIMLFPVVPSQFKDETGSYALNPQSHIFENIRLLRREFKDLVLIADIALDPFTTHGHDGLISKDGEVLNDETIEILSQLSLLYSQVGVDIVAPSDMMDGRVRAIRETLDAHHFKQVSILSYTAKYASSFYGPFRQALCSSPTFGHKKSYQMNPANSKEALIEAQLDEAEGADFLMIKPASLYLDIIQKIRQQSSLPIVAYHVSGEYAMLKAAADKKWLDFEHVLYETLLGIKRAGADLIVSYGAKEIATYLRNSTEHQHKVTTGKSS